MLQTRNILATIVLPAVGAWFALGTPLQTKTAIWAVTYYFLSGVGITAGYHRLWSHRSYTAGTLLQVYLSLTGAACFQGSIRSWSRDHRAHHRYVDSSFDPYSIQRGFWYAHMGWLILESTPKNQRVDMTDLDANRIVVWQHKNFLLVAITTALIFPCAVAGLFWGDWKGGLIYAGILRMFFFQQATFCVNSLAHWLGDQPYDDKNSPRNHFLTALVTFGEGYHNFHHEFPSDYRNGVKWYQYDPSKWFIWACTHLGLAYDLQRFSQNTIDKGEYQQRQKLLDRIRDRLNWGVSQEDLPCMTWQEFQRAVREDERQLIVIAGSIYEVGEFVERHPGGKGFIRGYVGKDATAAFNGGVYEHSNAAHNLLDEFRAGILLGGQELEKVRAEHLPS